MTREEYIKDLEDTINNKKPIQYIIQKYGHEMVFGSNLDSIENKSCNE